MITHILPNNVRDRIIPFRPTGAIVTHSFTIPNKKTGRRWSGRVHDPVIFSDYSGIPAETAIKNRGAQNG